MKMQQIQKYYDKENDSSYMISQQKQKKPSRKKDSKLKIQTASGQGGIVNQYTDILINIPPEAI